MKERADEYARVSICLAASSAGDESQAEMLLKYAREWEKKSRDPWKTEGIDESALAERELPS